MLCRVPVIVAALAVSHAAPAFAADCADQFSVLERAFPALPKYAKPDPTAVGEDCVVMLTGQHPPDPLRIAWVLRGEGAGGYWVTGTVTDLSVGGDGTQLAAATFSIRWDQSGHNAAAVSLEIGTQEGAGLSFHASEVDGVDFETPETVKDTIASARTARFVTHLRSEAGFAGALFNNFMLDGFADPLNAFASLQETLPTGAMTPGAKDALTALAQDGPMANVALELILSMTPGVPLVPIWNYYVFAEVPQHPPEGYDTLKLDAQWTPDPR